MKEFIIGAIIITSLLQGVVNLQQNKRIKELELLSNSMVELDSQIIELISEICIKK